MKPSQWVPEKVGNFGRFRPLAVEMERTLTLDNLGTHSSDAAEEWLSEEWELLEESLLEEETLLLRLTFFFDLRREATFAGFSVSVWVEMVTP